jgi:hypothetical protein
MSADPRKFPDIRIKIQLSETAIWIASYTSNKKQGNKSFPHFYESGMVFAVLLL